jgi:hypothetical protein
MSNAETFENEKASIRANRDLGTLSVMVKGNASARVWRSLGKTFHSVDDALNHYKRPAMRALIFQAAAFLAA